MGCIILDFVTTGTSLIIEWIRTFIIFSIIDRIIIKRPFQESLKNHDTYLLSLIVAGFLVIARGQDLSFFSFLIGAVIVVIVSVPIRLIFHKFIKK